MLPSLIQSPTSTSTGSLPQFDASNVMALRRSVVEPEHPVHFVSPTFPSFQYLKREAQTCNANWLLLRHVVRSRGV
jgi:hypothetical protein